MSSFLNDILSLFGKILANLWYYTLIFYIKYFWEPLKFFLKDYLSVKVPDNQINFEHELFTGTLS